MAVENIGVTISENNGATERLTAAVNNLASAADRLQAAADRGASGTRNLGSAAGTTSGQIGPLQRALSGVSSSMGTLQGAAGSLVAALSTAKIIKYSDDFTQVQNKLRLVTKDSDALGKATAEVAGIARATRNDFVGSANVYARLSTALKGMNKDTAAAGPLLTTVSQAVTLSGSTAESAKAGLEQFQQSLNKGKLSGEEFNSVMVGLPGLAAAIAAGLGKPVSALKAMADAQQLTSTKVLGALEKSAADVQRAFAQSVPTVAQGFTTLQSSFTVWLGTQNEGTGATNRLAGALLFLSDNMNIVAPVALAMTGALALGFVIIPSVVAIGTMVGALFTLTTAMATATLAFLATPVGWAVAAVVLAGAAALYYFRDAIVAATADVPVLGTVIGAINSLFGGNKAAAGAAGDANTGFAGKMKEVHVELNKITGGFSAATKGADAHRGGIGDLQQPYNQLGEKLESTTERLARLKKAEEDRQKAVDASLTSLGSAAVYSDRAASSSNSLAGSLDRVSSSASSMSGSINAAGNSFTQFGYRVNEAGQSIDRLGQLIDQNGMVIGNAVQQVDSYALAMQKLSAANSAANSNAYQGPVSGSVSASLKDTIKNAVTADQGTPGGSFEVPVSGYGVKFGDTPAGDFTTGHFGFGAGGLGYLATPKQYLDAQQATQEYADALYAANPKMKKTDALDMIARFANQQQGIVGLFNKGYATGGSFMVGGTGGTDTQPVKFWASPDERVTVETPAQQRRNDRGSGISEPQTARQRTRTTINNVVIKTYDVDSYRRSRRQIQQDAARRLSGG